ncbi:uracil-xanthine permease family protein [Nocardioides sp. CPCC 205120]|uniref:uracil-xanthine permease family protein n=1 Tax=Nocardioides sp. CPCC 205120 TaxID=3406462 RepID=UPI003B514746
MALKWKLYEGGATPPPGAVVAPDERLSWPRTIGLGAQHVVAMFGATFVFPIIMGLNPQLAVLMSGIATILFLLIVNDKIPSYLGTSAAFVAAAGAIRAQGGESSDVTGAILVAGLLLVVIGIGVHLVGGSMINRVLPPAVTGAVVMLIGFNLAPVVADLYWPADQWVAVSTMIFVIVVSVVVRGFLSRIAVLLGLVFGTALSWVLDVVAGPLAGADGTEADRVNFGAVGDAAWIGLPESITQADGTVLSGAHLPSFSATFILLIVPGVIALVAENAGHVKAVEEMTNRNLNPYMGRAFIGDGVGTALAGFVGGSPTTTYAENIGVMAATRVYSTAAYYVAALVAIVFGFSPKFGAAVSAVPSGVLGGITVVLYGMIGLLGAKIWVDNRVDFGNPVNLVPLAAGLVIGIGDVSLKFSDDFSVTGIALGTIVTIVAYHAVRAAAPARLREAGPVERVGGPGSPDAPGSPGHRGPGGPAAH